MPIKKTSILLATIAITIALAACKKVETITKDIQTPRSSFITLVMDPMSKWKGSSTRNYIDSTFYFQNNSDSTADITYKWDFGDGSTSEERTPSHIYKKRGQYLVSLITTRSDIASDTTSSILYVIVGQQQFALGAGPISTSAIDIVETKENNFLMLGVSYNSKIYPYNNSCFLMTLDSVLKQKKLVTLPSTIQLNGIAVCNDGNYISTGTTSGGTMNSDLVKITADGTIMWSKKIGSDNFVKVAQTADNGYVLTGSRSFKDQNNNTTSKTVIVKTDETGTVLWEKLFATDLVLDQTANTIVEKDGIVLAGNKRRDGQTYCNYCDSVCIVKLDVHGNIVWKNVIAWALNSSGSGNVRISKMKNGNYNVIASGLPGLFLFSTTGEFLDRKLMNNASAFYNVSTTGGGIAVLQTEYGNGFRAKLNGFNEKGVSQWNLNLNNQQAMPDGGIACCTDSWPVVVSPLSRGGVIFLANKVDLNDHHYTIVTVMADETGQVM